MEGLWIPLTSSLGTPARITFVWPGWLRFAGIKYKSPLLYSRETHPPPRAKCLCRCRRPQPNRCAGARWGQGAICQFNRDTTWWQRRGTNKSLWRTGFQTVFASRQCAEWQKTVWRQTLQLHHRLTLLAANTQHSLTVAHATQCACHALIVRCACLLTAFIDLYTQGWPGWVTVVFIDENWKIDQWLCLVYTSTVSTYIHSFVTTLVRQLATWHTETKKKTG